jgi:hypothetical protein
VDRVPLIGWTPLQPPDALQLCASLALQCRVAFCPISTVLGVNSRLIVGFVFFAAAVAASALDKGVKPSPEQAASEATNVIPNDQRIRLEAIIGLSSEDSNAGGRNLPGSCTDPSWIRMRGGGDLLGSLTRLPNSELALPTAKAQRASHNAMRHVTR